MGKSASPPDPYATSDAQLNANIAAVKEGAKLSAIDQNAPWGSTTYTKNAEGIPTAQNISLSPASQQNFDATLATRNQLAGNAGLFAAGLPTTAFAMPDQARAGQVEQALYNRKLAMIQPEMDRQREATITNLTNRGIPVGSEIWRNENARMDENERNQLAAISQDATLAGGQESDRLLQQGLTMRNQPYNEIGTLMAGASGNPMPNFQPTANYNVGAPNVAGNVYQSYQAQQQQNNSMNQGLFGLLNAGLGLFGLSDRRAKKDIRRVGTTDGGLPVYTFRYAFGGPVQMGVMADEVEAVIPDAVITIGDLKHVDYARIA